jgi:hypothetical protein
MIIMQTRILLIFFFVSVFMGCKKKDLTEGDTASVCTGSKNELEAFRMFLPNHPLNTDISSFPADSNSATIISNIGVFGIHADFGSGLYNNAPIGIPFSVVCGSQPKVPITYRANSYDGNYGNESDPGPFPIPDNTQIEGNGNGDSHVLVCDIENKKLYELYNATKNAGSGWSASCGAVFDLNSNFFRTEGWTSADASGMAILPYLVRYDEARSGTIDHAIRFTLSKSHVYRGYTYPATHKVSGTGLISNSMPMGARMRLKASFDISGYSPVNQAILKAMKQYGLVLADIGSDMFISGAPDERWDNDDLRNLLNIKSTDFEVVEIGLIK